MLKITLKKAIIKLEGAEIEIAVSKSEMDELIDICSYVEKGNEVLTEIIFKDVSLWNDRTFTITVPMKCVL